MADQKKFEGSDGAHRAGTLEERAIRNTANKVVRLDTPAEERDFAARYLSQKGIAVPSTTPESASIMGADEKKEANRLLDAKKAWFRLTRK